VFVHDAIDYMTKAADLRAAIGTAFAHCRPGGVALFVPDEIKERFRPRTDHGGNDDGERGARYLEWTWDPDPDDDTYLVDFAYLLREGREVTVEHDRHGCGVFPRALWLDLLSEAGFRAQGRTSITPTRRSGRRGSSRSDRAEPFRPAALHPALISHDLRWSGCVCS
jgi:hypothetical protein